MSSLTLPYRIRSIHRLARITDFSIYSLQRVSHGSIRGLRSLHYTVRLRQRPKQKKVSTAPGSGTVDVPAQTSTGTVVNPLDLKVPRNGSNDHPTSRKNEREGTSAYKKNGITTINQSRSTPKKQRQEPEATNVTQAKAQTTSNHSEKARLSANSGRRQEPTAWRSFLKSEVLGDAVSVLVLRDAEGRNELPLAPRQEIEPEKVDSATVVGSLRGSESDSNQKEFVDAIDSLAPGLKSPQMSKRKVPAPKDWKLKVQSLDRGFKKQQLKYYLEMKRREQLQRENGSRDGNLSMELNEKQKLFQSWIAIGRQGQPLPKSNRKMAVQGMTKTRVIDTIIREVWQYQLPEDNKKPGMLMLRFQPHLFSLLIATVSSGVSLLKRTSRNYYVKINADQKTRSLTFIGDRERCVSAAMSLRIQSRGFHEITIPFHKLKAPKTRGHSGSLDSAESQRIAGNMGCVFRRESNTGGNSEYVLIGFSRQAAEACARAFVSAVDSRYAKVQCVTNCEGLENGTDKYMRLVFDDVDDFGAAQSLEGKNPARKGRFMIPTRLAKGDNPARLRVDWNLIKMDNFEECLNSLDTWYGLKSIRNADQWTPQNVYSASFGQLKWPEGSTGSLLETTKPLKLSADAFPPKFKHGVMGLSQLLNRMLELYDNEPVSIVSELRVNLITHPFSDQEIPSNYNLPFLRMTFVPNPAQRGVQFKHARVHFPSPLVSESNILSPALATDVQLTHNRTLDYEITTRDVRQELAAFINHVENVGAGYGDIIPPGDAVVHLPFWPQQPEDQSSNKESSRASSRLAGMKVKQKKMFTSSVEFVQELRWNLSGTEGFTHEESGKTGIDNKPEAKSSGSSSQLVYTRISGIAGESETSTNEMLEVQHETGFYQKTLPYEERAKFLSSVNAVLSGLNKGVGLTHIRPKKLEESDLPDEDSEVKDSLQEDSCYIDRREKNGG